MIEVLLFGLGLVTLPLLTLLLVLKLDVPDESGAGPASGAGPSGWPWLDARLGRLKYWHAAASVVLTGLILASVVLRDGVPAALLAAVLVFGLFLRAWRHEFVTLMGCPDDAFPGRSDKVVWTALLLFLPPLGVAWFRSYRAPGAGVRRADAAAFERQADPRPAPSHDLL